MKRLLTAALALGLFLPAFTQRSSVRTQIQKVETLHEGKLVKARVLRVTSTIPMPVDSGWRNVQSPALLQFVAKGMISFKPDSVSLPHRWEQGETYGVRMRILGLLPFGGVHYLLIEKIDASTYRISTREWDRSVSVWNHDVSLTPLPAGGFEYTDAILIYAGWKTAGVTAFAKSFYKHRQKRWQLVASQNLRFGE